VTLFEPYFVFYPQPKARPTTVLPRYASLPSTSPPRLMTGRSIDSAANDHIKASTVGIGISAVHDAVLRGIARMPGKFKF